MVFTYPSLTLPTKFCLKKPTLNKELQCVSVWRTVITVHKPDRFQSNIIIMFKSFFAVVVDHGISVCVCVCVCVRACVRACVHALVRA